MRRMSETEGRGRGVAEPSRQKESVKLFTMDFIHGFLTFSVSRLSLFKCDFADETVAHGGGRLGTPAHASTLLRRRVVRVLEANPWLGGRIISHCDMYYLEWDAENAASGIDKIYAELYDPTLDMDIKGVDLEFIEALDVPSLYACVDRDVPLFRVSLVANAPDASQFMVFVSMGHCLGTNLYEIISARLSHSTITIHDMSSPSDARSTWT